MIKRYIKRDTLMSLLGNMPKNKELSENFIHNYFIQYERAEEPTKENEQEDEVIETAEPEA